MIVVSDTSPPNYLILIDAINLLPALFPQVYIPQRVADELGSQGAPSAVRRWIANPPPWIVIRNPTRIDLHLRLDRGEIEAICLAQELRADHLLIDESPGRAAATSRGLHVIGTLGILDQAAERNLIDLENAIERLKKTSYRIDPSILQGLLEANAHRRSTGRNS
jgi:predicted nucleic acid-binding protein